MTFGDAFVHVIDSCLSAMTSTHNLNNSEPTETHMMLNDLTDSKIQMPHHTLPVKFDEESQTDDDSAVVLPTKRKFDVNSFASKKSAANGFLDLALLMANASQLKQVILTEGSHRFYHIMLTLLSFSLIVQVILGIALIVLSRMPVAEVAKDEKTHRKNKRADFLNNYTVVGVFCLTVLNVFISTFSMSAFAPIQHALTHATATQTIN